MPTLRSRKDPNRMTVRPIHFCEPYERVALFIDGANLYQAARALGFDIDYRRLLSNFSSGCRLLRAYYYTALLDEQEYSPIRPLVDWLEYNGYTMVTKPLKEYSQSLGRRKYKGNMDVDIAVDAMEISPYVQHVVLFSGDGDFRRLVEALQRRGVRVTVVSTIRTQPPMIADELRRQADFFLDLAELQAAIERRPSGERGSPEERIPEGEAEGEGEQLDAE